MTVENAWGRRQRRNASSAASQHSGQQNLFILYAKNRSIAIRNRIAMDNDGLALDASHRWKHLCDVPHDDLAQIARMGLIAAVEDFDPDMGNAFSSFAVPRINGEIQHFLRDHNWDMVGVSRRSIEAASKVKRLKRRWVTMGRIDIDEGKIAASVGINARKWRQIVEETARKPVVELDEMHWVSEAAQSEDEALQSDLRKELARLTNPYRRCILERYFTNLSEEAIAQSQGVTTDQVHLWLIEGLRRLKTGHLAERRLG